MARANTQLYVQTYELPTRFYYSTRFSVNYRDRHYILRLQWIFSGSDSCITLDITVLHSAITAHLQMVNCSGYS